MKRLPRLTIASACQGPDRNVLELYPSSFRDLHKNIKYSVGPKLAGLGPWEVKAEGSTGGAPAPHQSPTKPIKQLQGSQRWRAVPQQWHQPRQGLLWLSCRGSRGMKGDINYWPGVNSFYESAFLKHLFCLVGTGCRCSSLHQKFTGTWKGNCSWRAPGAGNRFQMHCPFSDRNLKYHGVFSLALVTGTELEHWSGFFVFFLLKTAEFRMI